MRTGTCLLDLAIQKCSVVTVVNNVNRLKINPTDPTCCYSHPVWSLSHHAKVGLWQITYDGGDGVHFWVWAIEDCGSFLGAFSLSFSLQSLAPGEASFHVVRSPMEKAHRVRTEASERQPERSKACQYHVRECRSLLQSPWNLKMTIALLAACEKSKLVRNPEPEPSSHVQSPDSCKIANIWCCKLLCI